MAQGGNSFPFILGTGLGPIQAWCIGTVPIWESLRRPRATSVYVMATANGTIGAMVMRSPIIAAAVLVGLLLDGCGQAPTPDTKPVTPPAGTSRPTAAVSSPSVQGDAGPHEAENNGWKQRREPSAVDRAAADALAVRLRPALERVRRARDISPDATRAAVLRLGVAQNRLEVVAFEQGARVTTPPGAVIAVYVGATACVVGDVRPDRSQAEVLGRAAEFGCREPLSH